jgi:toluene monooxygenase electron transfer component
VGFDCRPGDTLLLAGLRAGWNLSYECASGGCGMCKVTLVSGEVERLWPDATGLTARDHRKGDRVLLCQSRPRGPCSIRPTGAIGRAPDTVPPPSRRLARVVVHEKLTPDTVRLVLDCGRPMPYLAGQFVLMELPDGTRRAYSMSREPASAAVGQIELLVRDKPGGAASSWLFGRLAVGDRLVVEGPYGRAHAQSPADRPVLCVGGGSGLGPVLAIAEHSLTETPQRPVSLFVGARSEQDVVLVERFSALHAQGADVVVAVEGGAMDSGDQGIHRPWGPSRSGRVIDVLEAEHPDLTGHDLYAAGPAGMIDALLATFVRTGRASADRVFFDRFVA